MACDTDAIMTTGVYFRSKYYSSGIAVSAGRIKYRLDQEYHYFSCDLAVGTEIIDIDVNASFSLYSDGELCAFVPNVHPSQPLQNISANIYGGKELELVVEVKGRDAENCQFLWLNPVLSKEPRNKILGALNDITISIPSDLPKVDKCITMVSDSDFVARLDTMLYSLYKNGNCNDATLVVFAFGNISKFEYLVAKYNVYLVDCTLLCDFTYKVKTVALSMAQVIRANKYLYLDADMLVLDDMYPIFDMIDVVSDDKILVCEDTTTTAIDLGQAMFDPSDVYGGYEEDIEFIGITDKEMRYSLLINNGIYAGSRKAVLGLESLIRATLPNSAYWEKFRMVDHIFWREQGIFNWVLARGDLGIKIDELYNLQLNAREVDIDYSGLLPTVTYNGKKVKVLHFNGTGRDKHPLLQSFYNDQSITNSEANMKFGAIRLAITDWFENTDIYSLFPNINALELYASFAYNLFLFNKSDDILVFADGANIVPMCALKAAPNSNVKVVLNNNDVDEKFFAGASVFHEDASAFVMQSLEQGDKYDFIIVDQIQLYNNFSIIVDKMIECLSDSGKIIVRNHNRTWDKALQKVTSNHLRTLHFWLSQERRELDSSDFLLIY